jgi:hypothetical protein
MSPPGGRGGPPRGSILVEVSPDGGGFTAGVADPGRDGRDVLGGQASMVSRLRLIYEDRVARYDQELWGMTTEDPATATSRYPELPVTLDAEETLVVDGELFEQLFLIYVYHGWAGIRRVEDAIARLIPSTLAGGTSLSPWGPAWRFFLFTRNLLAMLIREALAELERRAATHLVTHLSEVAWKVNDAVTAKYKITRKETTVSVPDPRAGGAWRYVTYTFGEQEESKALFAALTQAVEQRVAYEELLQRVARMRDHIKVLRGYAQRSRERGRPLSSERQLTAELDLKEEEQKQLEERSASLLGAMKALIMYNSPLGLLVLEGLPRGFSQPHMENALGALLCELSDHLDRLGKGIDPQLSQTAEVLGGVSAAEFDAWPEVQRARVPAAGPEAAVADAAVTGLSRHPAWFPLLHQPTLNLLLGSGEIPRDSFTFVVCCHYAAALEERLQAEQQAEKEAKAFWREFNWLAALASIMLLIAAPASGPGLVVTVLQRTAGIAGLVLLAHQVSSVTQQLARLDELRDLQLLHPDAFSVEGLGRLGELGIYRQELLDGITQQLLVELLLIASGSQWRLVKKLLTLHGYLQDVQTLLTVTADEANE